MRNRILGVAFAAALAIAGLAAGCGGGSDSSSDGGGSVPAAGETVALGSGKAYQAADQSQQVAYQAFGEAMNQMDADLGVAAQVAKNFSLKNNAGAFKATLGECTTTDDTVTCDVAGEDGGSCTVSVTFKEPTATRFVATVDLNCASFKEEYFFLDGHYAVDLVVDVTGFENMAGMQVKSAASPFKSAAAKTEEASNECLAVDEYELYEGCSETNDACVDGDADFFMGTSLSVVSDLTVIVYDENCTDGYKAELPAGFLATGAFCLPSDTVIDITSTQQSETQTWSCDFSNLM